MQAVTVQLPDALYERIRQAAEKAQRPLDEVLTEAVTAVAPVMNTASGPMRSALAQMAYLNDAAYLIQSNLHHWNEYSRRQLWVFAGWHPLVD